MATPQVNPSHSLKISYAQCMPLAPPTKYIIISWIDSSRFAFFIFLIFCSGGGEFIVPHQGKQKTGSMYVFETKMPTKTPSIQEPGQKSWILHIISFDFTMAPAIPNFTRKFHIATKVPNGFRASRSTQETTVNTRLHGNT